MLSHYESDNPGSKANLARILMEGRLGGSGKLVILPVDQGFEHGPARSFAPNPGGYDPHYHFKLAIEAGCNAYAAPLGFLEAGAANFAGEIPLILKLNNSDVLYESSDPCSAVTGSVGDALRLGCAAIGYTIYPGSALRNEMYENLRELAEEAKAVGLAVVVWSYPRGSGISKEGETAIDVVAYAAPLGFIEAGAAEFAGEIPLILKMNNHDVLHDEKDPLSAVTGSVKDALRLGCVAVGFTIYPGSSAAQIMYQQCREMILEAKAHGLVSVVWSYPRGSDISKAGETAVDVVAYAAQIAAQLGAHIIKVKPPTEHIEQAEAKKAYEKAGVPIGTLAERVRHVVQSAFDGRRVVIFSGGATKEDDEALFTEYRGIRDGGGFGSIIGRNSFQRPRDRALKFLDTVMKIYAGEVK
ncbi:MAG TPA: class I fructose-bisphosphate aldolase [Verrucomicrobiae bacterium]|nr:class I fructose-bisphosphate aldolase [Verrucomicrobiae bacterium]